MKCPHCKKEIDDDSIYCEYCGAKVVSDPNPNSNKGFKTVVFGLCAVLTLLAVGSIGYFIYNDYVNGASYYVNNPGHREQPAESSDDQLYDIIDSGSDTDEDYYGEEYDDEDYVEVDEAEEWLWVANTELEFSANGEQQFVYISSSPSWEITDTDFEEDWLYASKDSEGLYLWCDYNPDETRYNYITISNGYSEETIYIVQN